MGNTYKANKIYYCISNSNEFITVIYTKQFISVYNCYLFRYFFLQIPDEIRNPNMNNETWMVL